MQALRQVEELLKRDSLYTPAHLLRAQVAADRRDYATAIKAIDHVIEIEGGQCQPLC